MRNSGAAIFFFLSSIFFIVVYFPVAYCVLFFAAHFSRGGSSLWAEAHHFSIFALNFRTQFCGGSSLFTARANFPNPIFRCATGTACATTACTATRHRHMFPLFAEPQKLFFLTSPSTFFLSCAAEPLSVCWAAAPSRHDTAFVVFWLCPLSPSVYYLLTPAVILHTTYTYMRTKIHASHPYPTLVHTCSGCPDISVQS